MDSAAAMSLMVDDNYAPVGVRKVVVSCVPSAASLLICFSIEVETRQR